MKKRIPSQELKCPDYIEGDYFCCCIYGIRRNSDNHMLYVGQTTNLHMRIKDHYLANRKNKEFKLEIDKWMAEHRGEYHYEILKKFEVKEMDYWEAHFIQEHKTLVTDGGFNNSLPNRTPEREAVQKSEGNKRWYEKNVKGNSEKLKRMSDLSKEWAERDPEHAKYIGRKKAFKRQYKDHPYFKDLAVLAERYKYFLSDIPKDIWKKAKGEY